MSAYRITIDTVASGQPAPYADSETVQMITLEVAEYGENPRKYKPWDAEDIVKQHLKLPPVKPAEWHQTRLVSFTKVGPGLFKLHTCTPFTD